MLAALKNGRHFFCACSQGFDVPKWIACYGSRLILTSTLSRSGRLGLSIQRPLQVAGTFSSTPKCPTLSKKRTQLPRVISSWLAANRNRRVRGPTTGRNEHGKVWESGCAAKES